MNKTQTAAWIGVPAAIAAGTAYTTGNDISQLADPTLKLAFSTAVGTVTGISTYVGARVCNALANILSEPFEDIDLGVVALVVCFVGAPIGSYHVASTVSHDIIKYHEIETVEAPTTPNLN